MGTGYRFGQQNCGCKPLRNTACVRIIIINNVCIRKFPQDSIKFRRFHNLDCGATRTKQIDGTREPTVRARAVRRLYFDQAVLAYTGEGVCMPEQTQKVLVESRDGARETYSSLYAVHH